MKPRCPPGVFCIENVTLLIVLIIFSSVVYCLHQMPDKTISIQNAHKHSYVHDESVHFPRSESLYDSLRNKTGTMLNPYEPPLRGPFNVPINVPTQSVDVSYRQVGILTNGDHILPLMGRPLFTNRGKWNFYTMTDKNNMIKLPITYQGKNCTGEYGCQNVFSNDDVYVEGYNDTFKVTMYENDTIRYIPHL